MATTTAVREGRGCGVQGGAGRTRRTVAGSPLVQALVGCYRDEGGPEAVRAVLSWGGRVWGRVCRALSAVAHELSPVLVQERGVVVQASPTLPPVAEQVPDVALPLVVLPPVPEQVVAHVQRLTPPEPVREVPTAVQRLEAERVTPPVVAAEVVYRKVGSRYVAVQHPAEHTGQVYRKVPHGKAARYHAV